MTGFEFCELSLPQGFRGGGVSAINEAGDICGYGYPDHAADGLIRPIRWVGGSPEAFGPANGWATDINEAGHVVGWDSSSTQAKAFVYHNGTLQSLTSVFDDGVDTFAVALNNTGLVAGGFGLAAGEFGTFADKRGFLYDYSSGGPPLVIEPLPGHATCMAHGVNDDGDVVGVSADENHVDRHLFIHRDGKTDDLGTVIVVTGLSNPGIVVGYRWSGGGSTYQAFRRDPNSASFEQLGFSPLPGHVHSCGYGINDHGVVVGYSFPNWGGVGEPAPVSVALAHFPAGSATPGWYALDAVTEGAQGWGLEKAMAINDKGQIVGRGTVGDTPLPFLLTPKSSPSLSGPDIGDWVAGFVAMFGGAAQGGSGIGITYGGGKIPIPPHEWSTMGPAEHDALIGIAVTRLASFASDRESREAIQRAGRSLTTLAENLRPR